MTGPIRAEVVRWEPTGIADIDLAVARWRPASMVPASFKDDQGDVRLDDLGLAACICYDLDVSPRVNLPYVYVVKGVVRLMATLQRALAARAGWDLEEIETGPKACAWRIRPAGCGCPSEDCRHWRGSYRMTWDMAVKAGWADKDTYKKMPEAMLSARACTWLIDRYAPGVKLGITSAVAGRGATLADDLETPVELDAGNAGERPAPSAPRSTAPDGSTIPEPLREPEVDPDTRTELQDRIAALDPDTLADLTACAKDLRMPPLRTPRFTRAHGALLDRLTTEAVARSVGIDVAALIADAIAAMTERIPADVHDDSPETTSSDPDHTYRYDPAAAEPF